MAKNTIPNEDLFASLAFQNIKLKASLNALQQLIVSKGLVTSEELSETMKNQLKDLDIKDEIKETFGFTDEQASEIFKKVTE